MGDWGVQVFVPLFVCPSVHPSTFTIVSCEHNSYQSFWNFADVFFMVWRCACGLDRIVRLFFVTFYTPPHKKSRSIKLYPPNFECPSSIRLSVSTSFPCSNFSTFWPIFFKLCIDIGIGEEWYGIANGLISFWNNRVMALDVCQKCFGLRFHALTLVPFNRFSSNFA